MENKFAAKLRKAALMASVVLATTATWARAQEPQSVDL